MIKKYNYIVYIGRFQPLHNAHVETIKQALKLAETVIVVVGSANKARDIKNPFTWREREVMIRSALPEDSERIRVCGISDQMNDERWVQEIQTAVRRVVSQEIESSVNMTDIGDGVDAIVEARAKEAQIGIIGYEKDDSTYYLRQLFPQWKPERMPYIGDLHATDIRTQMYELKDVDGKNVPPEVKVLLDRFMKTEVYDTLVEEYEFIQKYRQAWAAAPYAPTFQTADAVVVQSGHILLVRRGAAPGRGLFAIPGGFVNQNERIEDAALRELREETKLKVPEKVLKGSIKFNKTYDRPDRSLRGRTITQAYLIELRPGELPRVKGADDADKAFWMPLSEVENNEDKFFEDHYMIIQDMVSKL